MALVSAQVLAGIRTAAERALTDTCSILRPWSGSDDGYRKGGRQTVAENVPCRLLVERDRRDSTGKVMDREAGRTYWVLAVAVGTDLRDGDTVDVSGLRYEVTQLFSAATDTVFVEAQITRIEVPES